MINRVGFCTDIYNNAQIHRKTKLQNNPISFKKTPESTSVDDNNIQTKSGISRYIPHYLWSWSDFSDTERYTRYVDIKKLNILGGDETHLQDIAEYLWNVPNEEIKTHFAQQKGFLGFTSKEKTQQAYDKVIPYVESVRQKVLKLSSQKQELELKKIDALSELTEQKNKLSTAFQLMDMKDKGEGDFPYLNGILLYGDAKANREKLFTWIKEDTGCPIEVIQYDENAPQDSIAYTASAMEKAETTYQATKVRTIIVLEDIDKLLTDYSTRQKRQLIGMFKSLSEVAAQKYHTTFIINTDSPVEDFEPASIGGQRFKLIKLDKQDLSDEEEEKLTTVSSELERLNDKAKSLIDEFTFVTSSSVMDENDFTRYDD